MLYHMRPDYRGFYIPSLHARVTLGLFGGGGGDVPLRSHLGPALQISRNAAQSAASNIHCSKELKERHTVFHISQCKPPKV